MTFMRSAATAAILTLALANQGFGQSAGTPGGEDASTVSEVVLRGDRGPVWWTVGDKDSIVYILVLPASLPTDMSWNTDLLERQMEGANRLITPIDFSLFDPRSLAGAASILAQAPKLAFVERPEKVAKPKKDAPPPPTLEETLPPDVRERFVTARTSIGKPAERYASLTPIKAAGLIEADYRAHSGLAARSDGFGPGEVMKTVEASAKRHRVKTRAAYTFTIPVARVDVKTTRETQGAQAAKCLDAALDKMVKRAAEERQEAEAWARGDVRPLMRRRVAPSSMDCQVRGVSINLSANSSTARKLDEDFRRAQVTALEQALKTPGHSLAVLPILSPISPNGNLMGQGSVLERMKAKGYIVETPAILE